MAARAAEHGVPDRDDAAVRRSRRRAGCTARACGEEGRPERVRVRHARAHVPFAVRGARHAPGGDCPGGGARRASTAFVICDHNAADNVAAAGRAARAAGCVGACRAWRSRREEEVHLVALLPDAAAAGVLHARVAAALPGRTRRTRSAMQVIANEHAEVLGFNASLLAGATTWTLEPRRRRDPPGRRPGRRGARRSRAVRHRRPARVRARRGCRSTRSRCRRRRRTTPAGGATPTRCGLPGRHRLRRAPPGAGRARAHLPASRHGRSRPRFSRAIRAERRPVRCSAEGGRWKTWRCTSSTSRSNGAEAGATRIEIRVDEDAAADRLPHRRRATTAAGWTRTTAGRATDPFFTTRRTRVVGLGLPLLRQAAEAAGGGLERGVRSPARARAWTATFRARRTWTARRSATWRPRSWCCWRRTRTSISTGRTGAARTSTASRRRTCGRRWTARRSRRRPGLALVRAARPARRGVTGRARSGD